MTFMCTLPHGSSEYGLRILHTHARGLYDDRRTPDSMRWPLILFIFRTPVWQ
jgi:hypothetical protein